MLSSVLFEKEIGDWVDRVPGVLKCRSSRPRDLLMACNFCELVTRLLILDGGGDGIEFCQQS